MRAVVLLALNELRLRLRDPLGLFWMFGFPLLVAILFAAVATELRRPAVDVALVDDGSPAALELRERLGEVDGLRVIDASPERARSLVRRGEAAGSLAVAEDGWIELRVDPSRPLERSYLELAASSLAGGASDRRVRVREVRGAGGAASAGAVVAGILWAALGCAATFAIAVVAERVRGIHLRLRALSIGAVQLVTSKALACMLAQVVVVSALLGVAVVALDVRIADPGTVLLAVMALAVAFAGLTAAVGAIGRTENAVAGGGWSVLLVLAMAGGAMIPHAVMPEWLAEVGEASPVRWGIEALDAGVRGDPDAATAARCAGLVAVGISGLAIGILAAHRRRV